MKEIALKPPVIKIILKSLLTVHTFAYSRIGTFACAAEGGVHPKHRLMNYHDFFIKNVDPGDCVLDIGCGNGLVTLDVARNARKVVGIDINPENIKAAEENKEKSRAHNLEFACGDVFTFGFNGKFDRIILSNVLEHIEHRVDFLRKLFCILQDPSSTDSRSNSPALLIRVPMINRDWVTLYKKQLGMEYRLDKAHFVEYTLESFTEELTQAGYKIEDYSIQFGEIWAVCRADELREEYSCAR